MQKRKVLFYRYPDFDGGMFESPELENPQEQITGYYLDVVTELIQDQSGNLLPQSEILMELEDKTITTVLPKQLIKFLD